MANCKVLPFLLVLLACSTLAEDVGCFVPGECTSSPLVGDWSTPDPQECLELCQELDGCRFFTHYALEGHCLGLAACVRLSQDTCQECYSGNSTCPGAHDRSWAPTSNGGGVQKWKLSRDM